MAAAPSPQLQQISTKAAQSVPNQAPALPAQPVGEPAIGGNISITPGQIIFTEYQARVFNQTEAMYKTTGYLGISLFEDSYGLSKKTAQVVVQSVPLSGTLSAINQFATNTYRTVLGIATPTPPPPPPPDPTVGQGTDNQGDPVSFVNPKGGNGNTLQQVSVATTPTTFSPATSNATIADVGPNLNNVPTTLIAETGNSGPKNSTSFSPIQNNIGPNLPMGNGVGSGGGGKIICNELYRQGFLSEEMWNADEQYGEMMFEKDPKLVIGYQMWARKVVKYMKKNPNNTKLAYWLFKPWTEYMGYKMGVVEKPTLRGRFTNWIGSQFSYMVFNLYNGKRLLDKYNYKVFKSENNIPTYKMA